MEAPDARQDDRSPARFGLKRLPLALAALACGYAIFIAVAMVQGYRAAARGEMPLYTDFTPTYAASLLVREIPAEYLYLPRPMTEAGRRAAHAMYDDISTEQARGVGFAPWMYPPTFILLIAPLAYLPYLPSWFLWLTVTALPYFAAIRQILPARLAGPFALAAPPAFFNVMYGQTGFLTGGLIGLGLALLERRPALAGALIGLASVKPHFGVLIPLALIAGGYWRALFAASLTVIAMIVASVVAFGDDPWFGFIGTSLFHLEGFAAGAYNFVPMTTVLSTLHMAGMTVENAWRGQYASAAAMALLVIWAWRRRPCRADTLGLRAAILCLATPLGLPMAYLYDLVLIVPAVAWLWADLRLQGARPWEYALLASAFAALLAVKAIAATFGVQIGALLTAALLVLAVLRYRKSLFPGPTELQGSPLAQP